MPSTIAMRDGTTDFSGGVNSVAVTTLHSEQTPGGLKRNQSAWIINATCRDGGLTQRAGWIRVATIFGPEGVYQGFFPYEPIGAFPYLLWSVNGNILRVDLDTGAVINLSQQFNLFNNPTEPFAYFVQAEEFCVIQSGDLVTLPLIWDGTTLRRSNGITGNTGQPSAAVYTITSTDFNVIPTVGNTVTFLTASTQGLPAGITISLRASGGGFEIGTFTTSNIVVNTSFDLTTVTSNWIGHNFPPFEYILTDTAVPTPVLINEIPAATTMVYYMDRIWYAQGRLFSAGDLVFGPSGTVAYGFRDSVLKVTENPLAVGGDGFIVPSQDGDIRALQYGGNIDAALGQGRLFIFTQRAVYALQVPVNRDDWIDAGADNQPLMTVVQLANGSVNDRSVVPVNGDLFYQSLEPSIRSLMQSVRYFTQWANTTLSANVNRLVQFNDRSLLRAASGIFFDNRLYETALPRETPQGIVHDAVMPLDVLPVSTFDPQRPPNWEGSFQGMPVFQMARADFGGLERAFAAVQSSDGSLELWEITKESRTDYSRELTPDSRRVVFQVENPAWTWGTSIGELELKKLTGAEIWIDRLFGTAEFKLEYRPDGATCWLFWHEWSECSPKDQNETLGLPTTYPVPFGECYKVTMVLPKPPVGCAPCGTGRPAYEGYQFQSRLTVRGFCRIRGIWLWAEPMERGQYPRQGFVC